MDVKWQDISTAPKNEEVLLYWRKIKSYENIIGAGTFDENFGEWNTTTINLTGDYGVIPTHWMPLPPPVDME